MPDDPSTRVPLPGSERRPLAGAQRTGDPDANADASVVVVLRPRTSTPPAQAGGAFSPRNARDVRAARAADPSDVAMVEDFARRHELDVARVDEAARTVTLQGPLGRLADAFGVELGIFEARGTQYRGRTGPVLIPAELAGPVQAVLGFDDRPQAFPHRQAAQLAPRAVRAFAPQEIAALYDFPPDLDGSGQKVAIIELGGGYTQQDLDDYFGSLGIPVPSVTAVSVDGATNAPEGDPNSADGEVALDIDVIGAVAPGAAMLVYFAPNTTSGFYNAIAAALDGNGEPPCAISISWGAPETDWTANAMDAYDALFADAAAMGVVVAAAAGDDGSSDRVTDGRAHVDFPASSPNALGCGGTRLVAADDGSIETETVWNNGTGRGATGGGVSDHFALPDYQASAGVPPSANSGSRVGRGVPDVAGDADPQTGYRVRVNGQDLVFGGTSAVAPLWSALTAMAAQRLGGLVGFLHPFLYETPRPELFRDIVEGNNGKYVADAAWDACTGWGSPRGTAFVDALAANTSG
jgi:kumamolisin